MADNLPDEIERLVLDWLNGVAVTQPVAPLMVRLTSTAPTDAAAGTQVVGDLYGSVPAGLGAAATASGVSKITNASTVSFGGISSTAAVDVYGLEIWDSATVPKRIAYQAFGTPVNVPAGQPFQCTAGQLSLTLG